MNVDVSGQSLNPWQDLSTAAPYVLPIDETAVRQFNDRVTEPYRLHLELMPEPFLGNPSAPVVLLNANPGFSESDLAAHRRAEFSNAARRNLLHQFNDYPNYLLDPAHGSSGRDWWERHLRALAGEVGGFQKAASSVFVAEMHGYHSSKYKEISLPSQSYTRDLVREAVGRDAVVIAMRAYGGWLELVPELTKVTVYRLRSPQNVTVSRRNCPEGFDAAVNAIRAAS